MAAGAAALLFGATVAVLIRDFRRVRRRRKRQLAARDMLRGLAHELSAGTSLTSALSSAARSAAEPVRPLADRLATVARLGPPAAGPSPPDDWIATALTAAVGLSRRHGVAVAGLVSRLADVAAQELIAEEEKAAALAGARLSGLLLAALPVLGIGLGAGIGANPLPVLLGDGLGGVLLIAGSVLCCAGLLWSARIAR